MGAFCEVAEALRINACQTRWALPAACVCLTWTCATNTHHAQASNGCPDPSVVRATAACADRDADVSGGSLEHLLVLATSVVTPVPSKALAKRRRTTCAISKLRNDLHKADIAKDPTRMPHLLDESQVFDSAVMRNTYYCAALTLLCPETVIAPTQSSTPRRSRAVDRKCALTTRSIGLTRINAQGDLNHLALHANG